MGRQSLGQCCSHLSQLWLDYKAVRRWLLYLQGRWIDCSRFLTLLIDLARRTAHVSPFNCELHWLWVLQRIEFRFAVLAYRCLNGTAPHYLTDGLHRIATSTHAVRCVRRRHRNCTFHGRTSGPSVIGQLLLLQQRSGTVCHHRLRRSHPSFSSEGRWRRNCSDDSMVTHISSKYRDKCLIAVLQSSRKTISVAMIFVFDDDDDCARHLFIPSRLSHQPSKLHYACFFTVLVLFRWHSSTSFLVYSHVLLDIMT